LLKSAKTLPPQLLSLQYHEESRKLTDFDLALLTLLVKRLQYLEVQKIVLSKTGYNLTHKKM
jgi:hypothetical protein